MMYSLGVLEIFYFYFLPENPGNEMTKNNSVMVLWFCDECTIRTWNWDKLDGQDGRKSGILVLFAIHLGFY
jgi:hypothetical protein